MNKSESKYFNTALRMDEALIELLEKKDLEYIITANRKITLVLPSPNILDRNWKHMQKPEKNTCVNCWIKPGWMNSCWHCGICKSI